MVYVYLNVILISINIVSLWRVPMNKKSSNVLLSTTVSFLFLTALPLWFEFKLSDVLNTSKPENDLNIQKFNLCHTHSCDSTAKCYWLVFGHKLILAVYFSRSASKFQKKTSAAIIWLEVFIMIAEVAGSSETLTPTT
jgi:hypothetical protein